MRIKLRKLGSMAVLVTLLSATMGSTCVSAASNQDTKEVSRELVSSKGCVKSPSAYSYNLKFARQYQQGYRSDMKNYYYYRNKVSLNESDGSYDQINRMYMNSAYQSAQGAKQQFNLFNRAAKKAGCLPYLPLSLN